MAPTGLSTTVLVPTHERPEALDRCLDALAAQHRTADEVVVVVRTDDHPTHAAIARRTALGRAPAVRVVPVDDPGVVAALNQGFATARGDLVCCTDDDAAPSPDWLARIVAHFAADERLGALGGRDRVTVEGLTDEHDEDVVGKVRWFGRIVGNHHRGTGAPRRVDVLKGVNMSFRRRAVAGLEFAAALRGAGSQPHNEVGFCLGVARRGWTVLYDPQVTVAHFPGPRRARPETVAPDELAFNQLYGLLSGLRGWRRATVLGYSLVVGSRETPGPVLAIERLARGHGRDHALRRCRMATTARLDAVRAVRAAGLRDGQRGRGC